MFLYENVAEIYFPVHYLTSRIKNANFVVKRWNDDTVVWDDTNGISISDKIVGKRMKKILSYPNELQSFREFIEMSFIYQYLTGETFIYAATMDTETAIKEKWRFCETNVNIWG